MKASRLSEDGLIERFFAPLAGEGALGLRDDAATLLPPPGAELVLTCDSIVEGVHFLPADPPDTIAAKGLGVNLSDLAAKGAEPLGFLLALALPADWTEDWLSRFAEALGASSRATNCPLLGGDTVRAAGPLSLTITAIGHVPAGRTIRRTTARPGDLVCVSGTIGDAVLGLALLAGQEPSWAGALEPQARDYLIDRYRRPRARLALARAVRDHASAAMDISDGLVGDLAKMMRVSGAQSAIDLDAVPFSPAAVAALAEDPTLHDRLVTGGDDYEILACVPPTRVESYRTTAAEAGTTTAVIGQVLRADQPAIIIRKGSRYDLAPRSFSHF